MKYTEKLWRQKELRDIAKTVASAKPPRLEITFCDFKFSSKIFVLLGVHQMRMGMMM
jgi:hypothetical protein